MKYMHLSFLKNSIKLKIQIKQEEYYEMFLFHNYHCEICLSMYPISMICRLTRSSMLEVMKQDYIILARSKGTPYKMVVIRHALKNAMLPVVTYAGPAFAFMLTGSFVIETVFSIPGIGKQFVTNISNRDYQMIMGLTIFLGALIITFNLITDIIAATIDPRIKLK